MSFLSNLFGGAPQINYQPAGFSAGGLSGGMSGGKYNIGESPGLQSQVGNVASTFGQAAGAFGKLGATVQPGFSQFRQAGLAQLAGQQSATTSNLRDALARRRVLGSSFGQDVLARSDAEFAQQKAQFEAQSYLQELDASNRLTQEQYQASVSQFKTYLDQSNLEAGIAAQLTASANQTMAQVATAQAQLDAQNAAGIGKLVGTVAAIGAAPFTGGASLGALKLFG